MRPRELEVNDEDDTYAARDEDELHNSEIFVEKEIQNFCAEESKRFENESIEAWEDVTAVVILEQFLAEPRLAENASTPYGRRVGLLMDTKKSKWGMLGWMQKHYSGQWA